MIDPRAARQQIDNRLARLRAMPYADLGAIAATTLESVTFGQDQWAVTTYVDSEGHGSIRVVVQIGPTSQPRLLLLNVQADGFRMTADGRITPLSEGELYEFM